MTTSAMSQTLALLKAIETGESEPVAVINPDKYIQHNLAAADGLAGFGALLQALPQGSARVGSAACTIHECYRPDHCDRICRRSSLFCG